MSIWDLSFGRIRVYQEVAACPDLLLPGTHGHIPDSCRRSRRFGAAERPGIHCFGIRAFHNSGPLEHVHAQSDTQQACSRNSPLLWCLWWAVSMDFRENDWFRLSECHVPRSLWSQVSARQHTQANKTLSCWFCSALLWFFFQRRLVFIAKEFVVSP